MQFYYQPHIYTLISHIDIQISNCHLDTICHFNNKSYSHNDTS